MKGKMMVNMKKIFICIIIYIIGICNISMVMANLTDENTNKVDEEKAKIQIDTKTADSISPTIADGVYTIETGVDSGKAVEVTDAVTYSGGNVQIFTKNNARCQKVEVKYVGNGYYTLQFRHSGKMLDVANGETVYGNNVWQCTANSSDAQKWIIKETEDRLLQHYIKM